MVAIVHPPPRLRHCPSSSLPVSQTRRRMVGKDRMIGIPVFACTKNWGIECRVLPRHDFESMCAPLPPKLS